MPDQQSFPFVVGCGRSGTTLVRALLDAHPAMAVPFESYFPVWFARRRSRYERPDGFAVEAFLDDVLAHESFTRWHLDATKVRAEVTGEAPANFSDAIRACFAAYARAQGKPRYADKTPIFVLEIPLLAELFPEAVFVHVIRDGRDVAQSRRDTAWGTHRFDHEALVWSSQVEQGRRDGRALGAPHYLEVRYEQLIDDIDSVARELCDFVGLDFEPEMLRYHERVGQILASQPYPEEHQNLLRPPARERDWRRDLAPRDVMLFQSLAGETLRRFGYESAAAPVRVGVRARALYGRARYASLTTVRRGRSSLWRALHRDSEP
jgi:hypothetical protein